MRKGTRGNGKEGTGKGKGKGKGEGKGKVEGEGKSEGEGKGEGKSEAKRHDGHTALLDSLSRMISGSSAGFRQLSL